MAPIPELEPARAYRLPTRRTVVRPVAEVMISRRGIDAEHDRQEVMRALAPIHSAPTAAVFVNPSQGWVASPVTAMNDGMVAWR